MFTYVYQGIFVMQKVREKYKIRKTIMWRYLEGKKKKNGNYIWAHLANLLQSDYHNDNVVSE